MRNLISIGFVVAIAASIAMPAMAKDWHNDHHGNGYHNGYDNGHHNGWNNGRHNGWDKHRSWNKYNKHVAQRVNHDWNWERNQYVNTTNWNRINVSQQRRLDAQMRAQWLAYHHNNWNGAYTWNTYRDPAFIDYLHTNNPSLLTQIRTIVGF